VHIEGAYAGAYMCVSFLDDTGIRNND
jgi:hypothetical protein